MAKDDYTAVMGIAGADGTAHGSRVPKPPTIKNKNKLPRGKKTVKMPKKSSRGIPYR